MLDYETAKKTVLEHILEGVKMAATLTDHEECLIIFQAIMLDCDTMVRRENYELMRERGES